MMQVGHIEIGIDGRMRRVDQSLCEMIGQTKDALIGRSVLDVTYPPDRDSCLRCMMGLRENGRPFAVVKRMMLPDGAPIWVAKTMAIAAFGDTPEAILATITRSNDLDSDATPAELLRQARLLLDDIADRRTWMESPMFVDAPSAILLAAYVAEAEGSLADSGAIARTAGVGKGVIDRWTRAMADDGLIEAEGDSRPDDDRFGYRLTQQALERCERYLLHRIRLQEPSLIQL